MSPFASLRVCPFPSLVVAPFSISFVTAVFIEPLPDRESGRGSSGVPINAIPAPIGADAPSGTRILRSTPLANDSISILTLSVSTSASDSPLFTGSPSCLIQRRILPSSIVSPILGISTVFIVSLRINHELAPGAQWLLLRSLHRFSWAKQHVLTPLSTASAHRRCSHAGSAHPYSQRRIHKSARQGLDLFHNISTLLRQSQRDLSSSPSQGSGRYQ